MLRSLTLLSLAGVVSVASAQTADPVPQAPSSDAAQQPAPIVRRHQPNGTAMHRPLNQQARFVESQPIAGVWLRSEAVSAVQTVTATAARTEIRLEHGRLNVTIHQPAQHSEILIDLPGGQISLLKNGLYTFNADTNTVRVLRGEAAAWAGPVVADANTKPVKIKEDHQLSLVAGTGARPDEMRAVESYPYELTADLLPMRSSGDHGYGDGYEPDYPRYENPYPYYAGGWGYPGYYTGYYPGTYPGYYGYGYPFAYGVGVGYYGGFGGGYGHRGGFRR